MKKVLQTALVTFILAISGHVIISNIEHITYLSTKTYTYDFKNSDSIKNIKESIGRIENNLEKLNKIKNSYLTNSELNDIKIYLAEKLTKIRTLEFLKDGYNKNVMTQKELFELMDPVFEIEMLGNIDIYRTLAKYNPKLDVGQFVEYNYMLLVYSDYISEPIADNYKYPSHNIHQEEYDFTVNNFMNFTLIKVRSIECVSRLVLESGDINE